jgi:sec-independent protein translocase protein TatA
MFLRAFEGWHLLIIVGLLVVLFGARKLPDSARSLGQSLRIFKSEVNAAREDEAGKGAVPALTARTPAPAPAPESTSPARESAQPWT